MCGRYAATADVAELVNEFDVIDDRTGEVGRSVLAAPQEPPPGRPDYNVAPTKQALVVLARAPRAPRDGRDTPVADVLDTPVAAAPVADAPVANGSVGRDAPVAGGPVAGGPVGRVRPDAAARRQLRLLTWGLVPRWSKNASGAARMINARVESVADKPAFARALASRRCLVPARGWYEWQVSPTALDATGKARRQPFFTTRADGRTVAMAGLYEFWRDPAVPDAGDPMAWLATFTVLTGPAEPGLDRVHHRQPVVLDPGSWARWLDPETGAAGILDLLEPHPPGRFTAYPVSRAVGNVRSHGPQLCDPAPPEDEVTG
ncbi:MAG: SOS response-associated peptidase [Dermatophilaceae bacterium]